MQKPHLFWRSKYSSCFNLFLCTHFIQAKSHLYTPPPLLLLPHKPLKHLYSKNENVVTPAYTQNKALEDYTQNKAQSTLSSSTTKWHTCTHTKKIFRAGVGCGRRTRSTSKMCAPRVNHVPHSCSARISIIFKLSHNDRMQKPASFLALEIFIPF